jgi:hypothetical protein
VRAKQLGAGTEKISRVQGTPPPLRAMQPARHRMLPKKSKFHQLRIISKGAPFAKAR